MLDDKFTAEQIEFLERFAANALGGRRVLCFFAHCLVGLGIIFAAIGGIAGGILALWQLHTGGH